MRDILFRGKRVENDDWVYGDLIHEPWGDCIQVMEKDNINTFKRTKYTVHKETVGQYTGLTDKNGVKIFEGDIVKITDKYGKSVVYVVEFYMGAFALRRMDVEYRLQFIDFPLRYYDFEVIGNIYGNPELLKEGGAERDH